MCKRMNGELWPRNVEAATACKGRLQQQLGAEQRAASTKGADAG